MARHADLADELHAFFADQERVDRMAAPLRSVARAALATAVAAQTTREPARGAVPVPPEFGGYEVLGEIGRGGMGVVYKARHLALDRLVALKIVRASDTASAEEARRLRNEAETVALLDHPGIVPVHDVGEHGGQVYLAMKLFEGGSLAQHLERYPVDPRAAARQVAQVARAVHHAHQRGVLHRDLKPSNVLLDGEDKPHVTDFGLAKRVATDNSLTLSGQLVGTPSYMAPEQAAGKKETLTTATDVYGLGAILYALLTGRPPFQGQTVLETLEQVRQQEPEWPSRRNPQVDRELEAVCLKALAKDPAERYATAQEMAEDLERWLEDRPIQARRPTVVQRLRRWSRRHQAVVWSGVGVLLLGAVMGMTALGISNVEITAAYQAEAAQRKIADVALGRAVKAEKLALERLGEVTRQQQRAADEAAIATAVNEFLQKDLLDQADIGNQVLANNTGARNPNITVRELLDRAAQSIEGKFAAQPLTEAAIRLTMGTAYRKLGRLGEAELHLERSVELRRAKLGADHRDTLVSKNELGIVYRAQGKYERAEMLFKEVLQARTHKLGADHPDTLASKNELGVLYYGQGKYVQAEMLFKEVLDAGTGKVGVDPSDTLICKGNLAALYFQQGQYDRAETLMKDVLEGHTAKLGADHPATLTSKFNLAEVYQRQGKYDPAETYFKETLEAQTATLGADHPEALATKRGLATLYGNHGKYDRAETLFKEALEAQIVKLGADHPQTIGSKHNLAVLYQQCGKYDRAETLLKEALEALIVKLGADHPHTLSSKLQLAVLYQAQGKHDRAEPLFREAVAGHRKVLGIAHPETQASIYHLSECYEKTGQPAQAESLLRELADFWKQKAGADSPQYAGNLAMLGLNLLSQEKGTEAEGVLRTCLAIRQQKQADVWSTFNTQAQLGGALLLQKQYAAAEPLLLQGYEGMKQREASIPPPGRPRLTEALQRLVQLYDAWGQPDKAAQWRKQLALHQEKNKANSPETKASGR
jgi:tetratricopeptide (TPR) repeat protein